jgi:hypothetical protein
MKYSPNGFIKPNGTFIVVAYTKHDAYIRKCRKKNEDVDSWVKVSVSCMGVYIFLMDTWNNHLQQLRKPTQAQIDTLFVWAKKFNHMDEYTRFLKDIDDDCL